MADLLCSQLAGQSLVLKRVSQAEPTNQHSPPSWCHFENTECNSKKTQEHSSTIRFKQPITDKKQSLFRVKRLIRCRSCCNNSGGVLWLAKQIPTHTLPEASLSLQTPTADTKQTTIAQLLCLNTTSLFSKTGQWTHTHIHTRSYCTHARTHTHTWCEESGSSMEAQIQAAGWTAPQPWRHVSFVVYEFISLLSWTLWTQSPHTPPLLPSRPVLKPYIYPLPTKAGKYSMALTRKKKRKGETGRRQTQRRETERSRERSSDVFLTFSFPPFLLRSLSVCLPAWLVKVSAARRAGLFWQPSNSRLSCPPAREKRKGGQI